MKRSLTMNMTLLGLAAIGITAAGCGGGGGSSTDAHEVAAQYAGAITSTDAAHGQEVYNATCDGCHSSGPSLENIGWDAARVRQQVREGSGHMPAIRETRVSAEDLEAVLAYLVTIGGVADGAGSAAQ